MEEEAALVHDDDSSYCCQCLTRYDCIAKFGMASSSFPFYRAACAPCKARNQEWIWVGCAIKEKDGVEWRRVHPETGVLNDASGSANVSHIKDVPNLCGLEFSKSISELPLCTSQLTLLEALDLSACSQLETQRLGYLLELPLLKTLQCKGCSLLCYPPLEVCNQQGEEGMTFLRQVRACGQYVQSMALFLVGDGEASKTSLIIALKSKDVRSNHIRTDARTVGIDISLYIYIGINLTLRFDRVRTSGSVVLMVSTSSTSLRPGRS